MELPIVITILLAAIVLLLTLILFLLFRINQRTAWLLSQSKKSSSSSTNTSGFLEASKQPSIHQLHSEIEVPSGTHFAQFLNEDPTRRSLPKKEKFKAYRAWRKEKGLTWNAND